MSTKYSLTRSIHIWSEIDYDSFLINNYSSKVRLRVSSGLLSYFLKNCDYKYHSWNFYFARTLCYIPISFIIATTNITRYVSISSKNATTNIIRVISISLENVTTSTTRYISVSSKTASTHIIREISISLENVTTSITRYIRTYY